MKPAPFDYVRPQNLDEACAILASDDGARLIAGGQTLVPMMAMRLARPERLVDIARIPELAFVRDDGDVVTIGATTKQCVIERDPVVAAKVPLLASVMPWIGHAATRVRGTIGGSLAHADPAAEMALVAVTLGAAISCRESATARDVAAGDFFTGPMMTALPSSACLTSVRFPVWRERQVGVGFHEVSARRSDFALVAAAAQVAVDDDGRCTRIAVGVGAVADYPLRLDTAATGLVGTRAEESLCREIATAALADIEPLADLHASADYRRRVAVTLAVRAIRDAYTSAAARGRHAR